MDNSLVSGVTPIWFPRLAHATPAQLQNCESSRRRLHWDKVDDDISIAGLLAGWGDQTHWSTEAHESRPVPSQISRAQSVQDGTMKFPTHRTTGGMPGFLMSRRLI